MSIDRAHARVGLRASGGGELSTGGGWPPESLSWVLPWSPRGHGRCSRKPTTVDLPPVMSVVVMPITAPTGDADAARVAETLTRSFMTELPSKREYGSVYVVSGNPLVARAGADPFEPREVGRRLNVRYILEGHVSRSGSEKY